MFHTPAARTLYYRVTRKKTRPSGVLSGMGSYYTLGGRYHRPHQRTVYASEDVLVAITRMAYYPAWNGRSGSAAAGRRPRCPCRGRRRRPTRSSRLTCSGLSRSQCTAAGHRRRRSECLHHVSAKPIEILNTGQAYNATQSLADRIRTFTHPHHPPHGGDQGAFRPHSGLERLPALSVRLVRYRQADAERTGRLEGRSHAGVPRPGREPGQPGHAGGRLEPPEVPAPGPHGSHPRVYPAPRVSTLPIGSLVSRRNPVLVDLPCRSVGSRAGSEGAFLPDPVAPGNTPPIPRDEMSVAPGNTLDHHPGHCRSTVTPLPVIPQDLGSVPGPFS